MPDYRTWTLYGKSMVLFNTFRDKIRFVLETASRSNVKMTWK